LAGFFQPILCSVPDQSIFFVLSKPFNRHGSKIRSLSNDREQSRTIYRERSRTTFGRSSDGNTADLELVETAGQPSDDGCYENGKPGFWNMGGFGKCFGVCPEALYGAFLRLNPTACFWLSARR
jgi:hypothetical protein